LVGLVFLFQNTYQYLLYLQQWSFVTSVCKPNEGSRWFSTLAGFSSVFSTLAGGLVTFMLPYTGLLGLMACTCVTLMVTLLCQDRAYILAERNGFDPAQQQMEARQMASSTSTSKISSSYDTATGEKSRLIKAIDLFRRVPTLAALFSEIVSFQSLNSILSVAFVRALTTSIPDDLARSAYTGRFYALVSGVSALVQFVVLPPVLERVELAVVWRSMPVVPLLVFLLQDILGSESLTLIAIGFFMVKTIDYCLRTVAYAMAYQVRPCTFQLWTAVQWFITYFSWVDSYLCQPLDFESRYLGKEIVGLFGSRFGKSGMSLLLSGLTLALGETYFGFRELLHLSVFAASAWLSSSWWLSTLLPKRADAQAAVEKRQRKESRKES